MKRIGILTAGGDTPALNATIHGAVLRACQKRVEVYGFIKGFSSLFNPRVPHVRLNPLFAPIPELDMTKGGIDYHARAIISRWVSSKTTITQVVDRHIAAANRGTYLHRRRRHLERHAGPFPIFSADGLRAPKTIDNVWGSTIGTSLTTARELVA